MNITGEIRNMADLVFWNDKIKEIKDEVTISLSYTDIIGLEMINTYMLTKLYPELLRFRLEAEEYAILRNNTNDIILKIANDTLEFLKCKFSDTPETSLHIMSSINAGVNLIGESDIDIGILVTDLDEVKLEIINKKLAEFGWKYSHTINPELDEKKYHCFTNIINGIEVEIKVRDNKNSLPVLRLHEYMDTRMTSEQRTIFTYAKLKFKELSKIQNNKQTYMLFKKILHETFFYYIDGGYLFDIKTT